MPTSARRRRQIDFGRLRDAVRGPGIDTRVWLAAGRIDDDVDAIQWDAELGWLVDVTLYGGELEGEGPVACRVGTAFAGSGATRSDPPERGSEVLVAITDGDPNSNPVVIARLHNETQRVPTTLQGLPLLEPYALLNHFLVTPFGAREQYGAPRVVTAEGYQALQSQLLALAGLVMLGGSLGPDGTPIPATQPFVRGAQLASALSTLTIALGAYAAAIQTIADPSSAATNTLAAAITTFNAQVAAALSTRVFGE